jgi:hypothetical protein
MMQPDASGKIIGAYDLIVTARAYRAPDMNTKKLR